MSETLGEQGRRPMSGLGATAIGRVASLVLARRLSGLERGSLTVVLPGGITRRIGGRADGPNALIRFHAPAVLWRCLARGPLGFAESHLRGEWDTPDLAALFRLFLDNERHFHASGRGLFRVRQGDRRFHAARANTRDGARRNIAAHYDLGNDFYAAWLDADLTYSSGIYETRDDTLEAAQERKYTRVLDLAGVSQGMDVLEIGCGWGGLAERAARRGARVRGITLSREQLAHGEARLQQASLGQIASLHLEDYRDTAGEHDAVISIEMIEAVGEEHWPGYFRVLADRLRPGGTAVLQAITIPERFFQGYRRTPDFIQRYIFPGGMLPTIPAIEKGAREAGLVLDHREHFAASYAATLEAWLSRFRAAWASIEPLGFDERFRRMWEYYLVYCMVGFERGLIDVGLFRLRKPSTG